MAPDTIRYLQLVSAATAAMARAGTCRIPVAAVLAEAPFALDAAEFERLCTDQGEILRIIESDPREVYLCSMGP